MFIKYLQFVHKLFTNCLQNKVDLFIIAGRTHMMRPEFKQNVNKANFSAESCKQFVNNLIPIIVNKM
jgi:hypothetical protein